MRRWLRGLSERDWRTIDRLFVAVLVVASIVDLCPDLAPRGPARR